MAVLAIKERNMGSQSFLHWISRKYRHTTMTLLRGAEMVQRVIEGTYGITKGKRDIPITPYPKPSEACNVAAKVLMKKIGRYGKFTPRFFYNAIFLGALCLNSVIGFRGGRHQDLDLIFAGVKPVQIVLEISLRATARGFEFLPTAKPAAVGLALSMVAHLTEIFYIYGRSKESSEKNKV